MENPKDGMYQAIGKQGSIHFTAGFNHSVSPWENSYETTSQLQKHTVEPIASVGLGSGMDKLKYRRSLNTDAIFWEHKTKTSVGTAYTETGYSSKKGSVDISLALLLVSDLLFLFFSFLWGSIGEESSGRKEVCRREEGRRRHQEVGRRKEGVHPEEGNRHTRQPEARPGEDEERGALCEEKT